MNQLQLKLANLLKRKNLVNEELCIDFDLDTFPLEIRKLRPKYENYVLELGSGWGEFSREMAFARSNTYWLALEKKKKRVVRSIRHQKKQSFDNLNYMIIDLMWFFTEVFSPQSFDKVIINFPDPWPKSRHHKHRFFNPSFLKELTLITTEQARIEFATDYWPLAEDVLLTLEESSSWMNSNSKGVVLKSLPDRAQSYFEQEKRAEGCECYFLEFEKR